MAKKKLVKVADALKKKKSKKDDGVFDDLFLPYAQTHRQLKLAADSMGFTKREKDKRKGEGFNLAEGAVSKARVYTQDRIGRTIKISNLIAQINKRKTLSGRDVYSFLISQKDHDEIADPDRDVISYLQVTQRKPNPRKGVSTGKREKKSESKAKKIAVTPDGDAPNKYIEEAIKNSLESAAIEEAARKQAPKNRLKLRKPNKKGKKASTTTDATEVDEEMGYV
jgi:histone H3/H4